MATDDNQPATKKDLYGFGEELRGEMDIWGNQLALNIKTVEDKVDHLEVRMEKVETRLDDLTSEVKEMKGDMQEMKGNMQKMNLDIQDLTGAVRNMGEMIVARLDAASEVK
jgi:peptidoglycan hydrolase CwlO-like protein